MGTSTKRINEKIKKILQDNTTGNLEEVIPQIAYETLRLKKTKRYFGDKEFEVLVQGGIGFINSVKKGTYKEDYGLDIPSIEDVDAIKAEEILEAILSKIEDEGEIESSFLLKAYKYSMTIALLESSVDVYSFIFKLITSIIYYYIMENINEAILEVFKDKSTSDFEQLVWEFSTKYVTENLDSYIHIYIEGKMEIGTLIETVINTTENITIGNF
jgi:hypothetical protein